jgi:branched-chain amino acid transport system substrate-binding protein
MMENNSDNRREPSRRSFLVKAGIGVSAAALLADLNQGAQAQSASPVIVGGPLPTTGIVAADGIEFQRGMQMAADEINGLGGILGRPIKLAFADTASGGDDVITSAAQRLIDKDGASALISGYNLGSQTAIQGVVADASIVYLHADTARAHTDLVSKDLKKYWGSFMYCPSELFYGYSYLDYIKKLEATGQFKPSNKKIALITGPITYSINIAEAIKSKAAEYGYEVSIFETVQAPTSEWGPTLAKIRKDSPGFIVITHFFPQDQAQFMIQFLTNPTDSLVYLQYGASLAAFRDIAGDASKGVLYATNIGCLQGEVSKQFSEAYIKRFGDKASANSGGQTYSALHMYAIAAAEAGGVGKSYEAEQNRKIADRLRTMIYRSPMGIIRFDPANQSAFSYPVQTNDPSLGMPLIYSQIKDKTKNGVLIAPSPYDVEKFEVPSWIKKKQG